MGARLGLSMLSSFSRQLGTMLDAGLPIRRALAVMEKNAKGGQKALYGRIGFRIEQGETLSEALEHEGRAFPVLFLRLVRVGETVGGLDKVFKRLADYHDFVRTMWHRLYSQMIYPVAMYCALIGVLAGLSYIRHMFLPQANGSPPDGDPRPALIILGLGVLIFVAPIVAYFALTRTLSGSRFVHEILIRLPVLGGVFRTLALARFSWAMELMTDSGVNIFNSIEWGLQATANGAFERRAAGIIARIKDGMPLSLSLEMSGLFPVEYLAMMHVAEESGSMPETFGRLARNYFEESDRAVRALVSALSWLVYIGVGAVMIYYILTLANQFYIGPIRDLSGGDIDKLP